MMRTLVASFVVVGVAIGVFAWGTDGFSAFTAEAGRRAEVLRDPRPIPPLVLEDHAGRRFRLSDYHGQPLAIEFIYVRCQSICRSMGTAFRQIQDAADKAASGSTRDLALLSISFDPSRDDVAALRTWAGQHGADGVRWRIARALDADDTAALLRAFGVVVVPGELGDFEHNAAIHLLDRNGRLVRISDIEAPDSFLAALGGL